MSVVQIQIHNLPSQPAPFIGRELEIAGIVDLLQDRRCRLLTLLGAGGMGKTRLAIESIKQLSTNDFEHGVFFVPLAPLTSADNIVTTVISVLGIMIGDKSTPQKELVNFLKGRNLLLVMDNFEHVLDGVDLVFDILNHAPDVKILVTSRGSLNLQMERIWHVQGMRYPDVNQIDNIDQYSALQLFIERATWVRRDFSLDIHLNCAIRICQLVGGMPLGIELAVSWLKTLSCKDIIRQIEQGIGLLSTHTRDIPERHRSIRTVFDHSWDLLTQDEQAIFPRLSIFRGGFTLEAAEQVTGTDLITLSNLIEKSMVRQDAMGRYNLHELVRQYAHEHLMQTDEEDKVHHQHMIYYATFMEHHTRDIKGRDQFQAVKDITSEFENIRLAWHHAVQEQNYQRLDQAMECLALYCELRTRYGDIIDLFTEAVEALVPDESKRTNPIWNRLRMWQNQLIVLSDHRPDGVLDNLKQCLHIARDQGDQMSEALGHWSIGEYYQSLDQYAGKFAEGIVFFENALRIYRELGDQYYIGRALRGMSICYLFLKREYFEQFKKYNQQNIELTLENGDQNGLAHAYVFRANFLWQFGDFDAVYRYATEAEAIWRKTGNQKSQAYALEHLCMVAFYRGQFDHARELIQECEQIAVEVNYPTCRRRSLARLGFLACIEENYVLARKYLDESLTLLEVRGFNIFRGLALVSLSEKDYQQAWRYVRSAMEDTIKRVFHHQMTTCLPIAAMILAPVGQPEYAVELLGLVFTHPTSYTTWLHKWNLLSNFRADLEVKLGTDVFQSAWERGTQLDLEETIIALFEAELPQNINRKSEQSDQQDQQDLIEPLTAREVDVLALLAQGLTNAQIAQKLYLSVGTVRVHTRNIYNKLNASNRTEAANIARGMRII